MLYAACWLLTTVAKDGTAWLVFGTDASLLWPFCSGSCCVLYYPRECFNLNNLIDEEANILRAVYDEAKELEAMYKAQASAV